MTGKFIWHEHSGQRQHNGLKVSQEAYTQLWRCVMSHCTSRHQCICKVSEHMHRHHYNIMITRMNN